MVKARRLTVRLDDDLDLAIKQACDNAKCDKTRVVLDALKKGLGKAETVKNTGETNAIEDKVIPKAGVSEVHYDSGCIERFSLDGKLRMHLRPDPAKEGAYLDLKNNRWSKSKSGQWIGIIRVPE